MINGSPHSAIQGGTQNISASNCRGGQNYSAQLQRGGNKFMPAVAPKVGHFPEAGDEIIKLPPRAWSMDFEKRGCFLAFTLHGKKGVLFTMQKILN